MDLREKTLNQNRHPWELSRADRILGIIESSVPQTQSLKIADIGAGDRFFDILLMDKLKHKNISNTIFAVDSEYNDAQISENDILLYNSIHCLENGSMDCIVMMDVLEHIENDGEFLKSVLEKLKTNGILLITVPAFQSLYSSHDAFLKHYRRYSYKQLKNQLQNNGLKILRMHYFYTSLCLVRWLQVNFLKKKTEEENTGIGAWRHSKNGMITKTIEFILNADFSFSALLSYAGILLPGLSLLLLAVKTNDHVR